MFIKMGFKTWTRGQQIGIRVYTPSIRKLAEALTLPSNDKRYKTLGEFVKFVSEAKKRTGIPPYSRKIEIISNNMKKSLQGTLTIAQHNHSTQGYITIGWNNWLTKIARKYLNQDFDFEYIVGEDKDILILPNFKVDIWSQRENELEKFAKVVNTRFKKVPSNLDKIGLYFELKEIEHIKKNDKLIPYHRYPFLESKIESLRARNITCDIDVFDTNGNFIKFVEVKAVYGIPKSKFVLTTNEFESREICKKNKWNYEIVVYYNIGKHVIKREVIPNSRKLKKQPLNYLCWY